MSSPHEWKDGPEEESAKESKEDPMLWAFPLHSRDFDSSHCSIQDFLSEEGVFDFFGQVD